MAAYRASDGKNYEGPVSKVYSAKPKKLAAPSSLRLQAGKKAITVKFKKVKDAAGYEIYQYDNAKKAWEIKAALDAAAVSYTVEGLTPAEEYRFAIRAFVKPEGRGTVYSKTYVSLDTATMPKAVNFKVSAGKKKATVKWNKVKGATGYTVSGINTKDFLKNAVK